MKNKYIAILIFLLINSGLSSQTLNWEIISSAMNCKDIAIENDTIWVATDGGLSKFMKDGTLLKKYTSKDGLSHTDCSSIAIDSRGIKYIGTARFVSKFDGKNFTTIEPVVDGSVKVLGVSALQVGLNDKLYFYTLDGLSVYDGNVVQTSGKTIITTSIYGIQPVIDKTGKLWFVDSSGNFCMFDGINKENMNHGLNASNITYFYMGSKLSIDKNNTAHLCFPNNNILSLNISKWDTLSIKGSNLCFDSNNNKVILRNDSIINYSNNTIVSKVKLNLGYTTQINKFGNRNLLSYIATNSGIITSNGSTITKIAPASIAPGKINAMSVESNGNIWVCSESDISCFKNENWEIIPQTTSGIQYGGAYWMNIDANNKKWFGTYMNGILLYDDQTWTYYNSQTTPALTTNNFTCSHFVGSKKWFGTNDKGVFVLENNSWNNYSTASGLVSNYVYSITSDNSGALWVATDKGVSQYKNGIWTTINTLKTYLIYKDSKNRIWTGHDGYVQYFDGTNWNSFSDYITLRSATFRLGFGGVQFLSAQEDKMGKIWFGYGMSMFGGYFYFDGTNFIDPDPENASYVTAPMRSIIVDKQNRIWLGAVGCTVITDTQTGLHGGTANQDKLSIYCSNTLNSLFVGGNSHSKSIDYIIYDINGHAQLNGKLNAQQVEIDISNLKSGVYIFKSEGEINYIQRFLKL